MNHRIQSAVTYWTSCRSLVQTGDGVVAGSLLDEQTTNNSCCLLSVLWRWTRDHGTTIK